MNSKLLTVSIAAYQMERYIENALDSVCLEEIISRLEIFVVDDGGTDRTMELAAPYAARYPESVFLIHKENGGYGSTVNESLARASGKYFKLLDGDDWYNPEGLVRLVREMEAADADILVTNNETGPAPGSMAIQDFCSTEGAGTKNLDRYVPKSDLNMWAMAVRTQLLRDCGLKLPEHMLYTDVFYVVRPLAAARTIRYLDFSVYCYRTERDGQSMSRASIARHYPEMMSHSLRITRFCRDMEKHPNYPVLLKKAADYHTGTIRFLLWLPAERKYLAEIRNFDRKGREISPAVYRAAEKAGKAGRMLALMRRTGYLSYWLLKLRKQDSE